MQSILRRIPPLVGIVGGVLIFAGVYMDGLLSDFRNGWFISITILFIAISGIVGALSIYRGGMDTSFNVLVEFVQSIRRGISERGFWNEMRIVAHALWNERKNIFSDFSFVTAFNYVVLAVSAALIFFGFALFGIIAVVATIIADCFSGDQTLAA